MNGIPPGDKRRIVDALAETASQSLGATPAQYFRELIARAELPPRWAMQTAGVWTGDAPLDARRLVDWCIGRGVNPADPRRTTLGAVLGALLEDVGADRGALLAAVIVGHGLWRDDAQLAELSGRYQVPLALGAEADGTLRLAAELDWHGPEGDEELQRLWVPEPPLLDVGFLQRAIACAKAVCRIETERRDALGTGFLVAPGRVLTSRHVLAPAADDDPAAGVAAAVFRFGCIEPVDGAGVESLPLRAALLASSPVDELDFALVELEADARGAALPFLVCDESVPRKGAALNILQHPGGRTMKLALSANGVSGVYDGTGRIQYATSTAGGSSGSPCLTDDWSVVALHRAERARALGSIREGVLVSAVRAAVDGAF